MRRAVWWLAFLAFALAQTVPTSDFFRISQTTSRSTTTPGAWRYSVIPRTREARVYWDEVTGGWIRDLRAGLPVRFDAFVLRLQGEQVVLTPGCTTYAPDCFDHPPLGEGLSAWRLDFLLTDLHNALVWVFADARRRSSPYPATVAVSKFLRFTVGPEGVQGAEPLGWKP